MHRDRITGRLRITTFGVAMLFAAAAVATACGGGGGYGSSNNPSPTAAAQQQSPLAGGAVAPTASAAQPTSGAAQPTTAAASADLTIVAMNISYDKTSLQAPAGQVKLTLNNQDAIAHNLHVFKGTDASGQSVGMTPIEAGPVQNTISADLAPGTYYYQCDVHPTQMHGTLTVQ